MGLLSYGGRLSHLAGKAWSETHTMASHAGHQPVITPSLGEKTFNSLDSDLEAGLNSTRTHQRKVLARSVTVVRRGLPYNSEPRLEYLLSAPILCAASLLTIKSIGCGTKRDLLQKISGCVPGILRLSQCDATIRLLVAHGANVHDISIGCCWPTVVASRLPSRKQDNGRYCSPRKGQISTQLQGGFEKSHIRGHAGEPPGPFWRFFLLEEAPLSKSTCTQTSGHRLILPVP